MSKKLRKPFLFWFSWQQDKILMMFLDQFQDLAVGVACGIANDQFVVCFMPIEIGVESICAELNLGGVAG